MALHRDIYWVGRQSAVTGYGLLPQLEEIAPDMKETTTAKEIRNQPPKPVAQGFDIRIDSWPAKFARQMATHSYQAVGHRRRGEAQITRYLNRSGCDHYLIFSSSRIKFFEVSILTTARDAGRLILEDHIRARLWFQSSEFVTLLKSSDASCPNFNR